MSSSVNCQDVAEAAVEHHVATHSMNHYGGLVTLHGLVRLAESTGSERLKARSRELLRPFYSGEVTKVGGAYSKMYCCGGNATGWLVQAGFAPEALPTAIAHAEELIATHPRDSRRIFSMPKAPEKIWIDSAFAVCPFLTYAGNLSGRREFLDEAAHQMLAMDEVLRNRENNLYHQSLNFAGPDKLSEDHWGRGNGWAALALAELAAEMPEDHPRTAALRELFVTHMTACVRFQNAQGMWHQEMTVPDSYVETSGAGLILYAIGRGLEKGLLPASFRENFVKGLRGYLTYIALDGSVFNTCTGCLCPGNGTSADYQAKPWRLNDEHSFGPVVLTFGQAIKLGITSVIL